MNRRQFFLSTSKAALASALGWSWLRHPAQAQEELPGERGEVQDDGRGTLRCPRSVRKRRTSHA